MKQRSALFEHNFVGKSETVSRPADTIETEVPPPSTTHQQHSPDHIPSSFVASNRNVYWVCARSTLWCPANVLAPSVEADTRLITDDHNLHARSQATQHVVGLHHSFFKNVFPSHDSAQTCMWPRSAFRSASLVQFSALMTEPPQLLNVTLFRETP